MNATRNIFWRLRNIWNAAKEPSPEEKDHRDQTFIARTEHRPSLRIAGAAGRNYDQARLEEFRLLVGITQHESFRAPHGWKLGQRPIVSEKSRSAPNMGLYTHVVDQEAKSRKSYVFFTRLINVCLGAQLIVAAALTAIGAAGGNRGLVTAFGAINTVLAGIMTFLKGSGLPNRIKYFQHEWGSLREYVEQRERDIICGFDIDVQQEIETIRRTYEHIKSDVEANTPDRFVSNTRSAINTNGATTPAPTPYRTPSMMKIGSEADSDAIRQSYMSSAITKPKNAVIDRVTKVEDMEKRVESYASDYYHERQRDAAAAVRSGQEHLSRATSFGSHLYEDMHGLRNKLQSKLREVNDLEKEIEHRGSVVIDNRRNDINSAVGQVQQAGTDARASFASAAARNEAVARDSLARSAEAASAAIEQRQAAAVRAVDDSVDRARGFAHDTVDRSFERVGGTASPPPPNSPPPPHVEEQSPSQPPRT